MNNNRLLLLIDILGFTNLVENSDSNDVLELLKHFNYEAKIQKEWIDLKLKSIYFSDTLVFYSEPIENYNNLEDLCSSFIEFVLHLSTKFLAFGIPIRGAIDFDEFFIHSSNEFGSPQDIYFGKALINAHNIEQVLNGIVIGATDSTNNFFKKHKQSNIFIPLKQVDFLLKDGKKYNQEDLFIFNIFAYRNVSLQECWSNKNNYKYCLKNASNVDTPNINQVICMSLDLFKIEFFKFSLHKSTNTSVSIKYENSLKFVKYIFNDFYENVENLINERKNYIPSDIEDYLKEFTKLILTTNKGVNISEIEKCIESSNFQLAIELLIIFLDKIIEEKLNTRPYDYINNIYRLQNYFKTYSLPSHRLKYTYMRLLNVCDKYVKKLNDRS